MKTVKDGNLYKAVKQVERTYWKYDDFVQPVLTANGAMGGDSFACDQSNSFSSTTLAWRCFNGDSTTESETNRWQINNIKTSSWYWLAWYNPIPLNITSLSIYNSQATYVVKAYKIQASDDNTNWVDIVTGTNTNTGELNKWVIDMSNNQAYYKYYRIYCRPNSTTSLQVAEIEITANYIAAGTAEDYDFYTDENVYKGVNL